MIFHVPSSRRRKSVHAVLAPEDVRHAGAADRQVPRQPHHRQIAGDDDLFDIKAVVIADLGARERPVQSAAHVVIGLLLRQALDVVAQAGREQTARRRRIAGVEGGGPGLQGLADRGLGVRSVRRRGRPGQQQHHQQRPTEQSLPQHSASIFRPEQVSRATRLQGQALQGTMPCPVRTSLPPSQPATS